jgi:hypothetical protein
VIKENSTSMSSKRDSRLTTSIPFNSTNALSLELSLKKTEKLSLKRLAT